MAADGVFDFFRLPQEIRDAIYSNLVRDITFRNLEDEAADKAAIPGLSHGIQIAVHNVAVTKFLLLSRQFSSEYKEQMKRVQTILAFKDSGGNLEIPKVNSHQRTITKLDIHILGTISCKDGIRNDIPAHCRWMSKVLPTFAKLQYVKVSVYICLNSKERLHQLEYAAAEAIREVLIALTMVPGIRNLEVLPYPSSAGVKSREHAEEIYTSRGSSIAEWSVGNGWKD